MSSPWGGDPGGSGSSSWDGGYGTSGPVDPHAGQPAPVPAHPAHADPGAWQPVRYAPRRQVPGTIVAGSVVGCLFAVLLLVSGLFLLFFGSVLPDSFDEADSTLGDGGVSLLLAGLGNWIAVVLIVTAGVLVSVRRPAGMIVTVVAWSLIVLLAVSWFVLYPGGGVLFWGIVHVAFGSVAAGLILLPTANRAWLTD